MRTSTDGDETKVAGLGDRTASAVPSSVFIKSDRSMVEPTKLGGEPVGFDARTQTQRAPSPAPSGVSLKSDRSMLEPPKLSDEPVDIDQRTQTQRAPSPAPSGVSLKSDRSMLEPPKLSDEPVDIDQSVSRTQAQRAPSPAPSGVSLKSDRSMLEPPKLSDEPVDFDQRPQTDRSVSPVPSHVSMKSDWSKHGPPNFSSDPPHSDPKPQTDRSVSPVPSHVSMKSDWSKHGPPNFSSDPPHSDPKPQTDRSVSPVPSHVSMKSDWSKHGPPNFSSDLPHSAPKPQTDRSVSPVPSHVSMKSDWSKHGPPNFSSDPPHSDPKPQTDRSVSPVPSHVSMKSDWSKHGPPNFSSDPPHSDPKLPQKHGIESPDPSHLPMKRLRSGSTEVSSDNRQLPTYHTANKATDDDNLKEVIAEHKTRLKRQFENVHECLLSPATHKPHKSIYIDLHITEGESKGVDAKHEFWQGDSASRTQTADNTQINYYDIFKALPGQKHIRTVLTKGVACIGKTVLVQKFIIDWAEGRTNQDIDFVFVLPFRLLNRIKDRQYSLHQLLLDFYPELEKLTDSVKFKDCQILFICFALDEGSLPLNFWQNQTLFDVTETSMVDSLITSLIQGSLLPSAHIWITSRPVASNQIPPEYISKVTEVRGFTDSQKEEYFKKRIGDEDQAKRIISCIKACRSLHIMCQMPVFCWIASTVLEEGISEKTPTTLTEMFIHFLMIQTMRQNQKYQASTDQESTNSLESQKEIIMRMSELAFRHLEKGNFMFSEEEVRECGLDLTDALVKSGLCTDGFKGDCALFGKMYTFVHVTIQEFLAALYVFVSFVNKNVQTLEPFLKGKSKVIPKDLSLDVLLKNAVNRALESKSGHLDLFVRFLHGISLESNQRLLKGLLTQPTTDLVSVKKAIQNLKEMDRPNISPDRWINLLRCLVEMRDSSLNEEVQAFLKSEKDAVQKLRLAHCSALANMLLMAEEPLDELDLKKYKTSDEGRRRLIPVVRWCRRALLADCKLTEKCCEVVVSALESAHSPLIQLDLSHNNLQRSEERLLRGLQSQHCKLESLSLARCKLTMASYKALASVLRAESSPLRQLNLSQNGLKDSGVEVLCAGLESPNCNLQMLRLSDCGITEKGCECLASALSSNPSQLRELDLSYNHPGDTGVKLLSERKDDPDSALKILIFS